jgi:hypothetical protein
VRFDQPQSAVAPGQAVVLYDGETVLGGGWIDRTTTVFPRLLALGLNRVLGPDDSGSAAIVPLGAES